MVHDAITRNANNVSWAEIWEFSKSQRDIIDAINISNIIVFDIICNVAKYYAAKFSLPIEQASNMAANCGFRWSCKLKVKPNLGCCSNIAITISYILVLFHLGNPKIELRPFNCEGHPVSLWRWPLTCDLETCCLLRSFLGMYNQKDDRDIHIFWQDIALATCSPKHEFRGQLWGQPVTSSMTSSPWKLLLFGIIWDNLFISEVKLKLCLRFEKFQNGRNLRSRQTFYRL